MAKPIAHLAQIGAMHRATLTHRRSPEGWVWEFLRRNSEYRAVRSPHAQPADSEFAQRSQAHEARSTATTAEAATWGLIAFRRSGRRGGSG